MELTHSNVSPIRAAFDTEIDADQRLHALVCFAQNILIAIDRTLPDEIREQAISTFSEQVAEAEMDTLSARPWEPEGGDDETKHARKEKMRLAELEMRKHAVLKSLVQISNMAQLRQYMDLSDLNTNYLDQDGQEHDLLDELEDRMPDDNQVRKSGRKSQLRAFCTKASRIMIEAGLEPSDISALNKGCPASMLGEVNAAVNKVHTSKIEDKPGEYEWILSEAKSHTVHEFVSSVQRRYATDDQRNAIHERTIYFAHLPVGETRVSVAAEMERNIFDTIFRFRLAGNLQERTPDHLFSQITPSNIMNASQAIIRSVQDAGVNGDTFSVISQAVYANLERVRYRTVVNDYARREVLGILENANGWIDVPYILSLYEMHGLNERQIRQALGELVAFQYAKEGFKERTKQWKRKRTNQY